MRRGPLGQALRAAAAKFIFCWFIYKEKYDKFYKRFPHIAVIRAVFQRFIYKSKYNKFFFFFQAEDGIRDGTS